MERIVLIPAYKPGVKMLELVKKLSAEGLTVLIVDDGSGAEYRDTFDNASHFALVIRSSQNGGKGAAIKQGLEYIQTNFIPPYRVITADADGQHRIKDILRVAELSCEHPEALVLGCRPLTKNMPPKNWWGNMFTKIAFFLATGKYVHDSQTGLRGFSDLAVPFMLRVEGERYEYEMNVLMLWARNNLPVFQQPVKTIYFDSNSSSHFRPVQDSVLIYRELLRFSAPSFLCFVLDMLFFGLLFYLVPLSYPLLFANVCARVLTSVMQFAFLRHESNKYFSFSEISALKYFLLAAVLLILNTVVLMLLFSAGMPPVWAKLLSNIALFFIGLAVRRKTVYSNTILEDMI